MQLFKRPPPKDPMIELQREGLDIEKQKSIMNAGSPGYDEQYFMQSKGERDQLLKWQQDLDPDLLDLAHDLMNEVKNGDNEWEKQTVNVWDEDKGLFISKPMKPRMNKQGVSFVLTNIKRYINRNTMRCSLDVPTVNKKMKIFGNALAIALAVNNDTFGINMTEYPIINSTIRSYVHFTLLRALNDGERRNEREIRRMIESTTDKPEKKKGFNPFGGE